MDKDWAIAFVSTIISVLFGILGTLWLKDRRGKCLGWEVELRQQLVTRNANEERIQILFDGVQVQDPYITAIRVTNVGSSTIAETDFRPPIAMTLEAKILQLISVFDPPMSVKLKQVGDDKIELVPLMLNKGESFSVVCYTENAPKFGCSGRLADGEIRELRKGPMPGGNAILLIAMAVVLATILVPLSYAIRSQVNAWWKPVLLLIGLLVALGAAVFVAGIGKAFIKDRSTWPTRWR